MQRKLNKNFNPKYKKHLYNELLNLIGHKKTSLHRNTTLDALNEVIKHDEAITNLCNQFCVSKPLIQSVLFNALWSLDEQNRIADNLVENYFNWKQECEDIFKLAPLGFNNITYPDPSNPILEDTPTGIGKISAGVAIAAHNAAIDKCLINSIKYHDNDWHHQKVMWYNLKSNNDFCIKMVVLVIRYCAEQEEIFGEMFNCNKKQLKLILSRYNNTNDDSEMYFEECYRCYKVFKRYS